MTVHRPHPITGPWPYTVGADDLRRSNPARLVDRVPDSDSLIYDDPDDAILYDACDRCAEHAEHPQLSLDPERLGRLWTRMVEVERDPTMRAAYQTGTEARGARLLYRIAIMVERTHPGIDPWRWPWTRRRTGNVGAAMAESLAAPGHAEIGLPG